jgi:hypothetical protein
MIQRNLQGQTCFKSIIYIIPVNKQSQAAHAKYNASVLGFRVTSMCEYYG